MDDEIVEDINIEEDKKLWERERDGEEVDRDDEDDPKNEDGGVNKVDENTDQEYRANLGIQRDPGNTGRIYEYRENHGNTARTWAYRENLRIQG